MKDAMILSILTRFTPALITMTLGLTPIAAVADSHANGSFAVVDDSGTTLMALDLVEANGQISGTGVVPADGLPHGPGVIAIRQGARLGEDLHLILRLDAHDPALPDASSRMTVMDGAQVRLIYNGKVTTGAFQSIPAGSVTIAAAPPAPALAPEPALTPEPAPAPETVPAPETATIPASCLQLEQVTSEIDDSGDQEATAEVRNITSLYGLSNGGALSEAKCQGALAEITAYVANLNAGSEAEACYAVADTVQDIADKETATGNPVSTQPDLIMTTAGMITNSNPNGVNNADSCGRALAGLYTYLDSITAPETATASTSGSIDLPEGYRLEPIVNVNLGGDWNLAAGGEMLALWSQGRSTIAYETGPDQRRVAWFWEPRAGLVNAGVTRGTLFIEGTRDRGRFEGEARHYVTGCGVFVYPVTGRVRERETVIRITGDRPNVAENCAITGVEEQSFRMEFVADNPPGEPNLNTASSTRGASSTPDFGVWALRYEVRNIDRGGALNVRRNPAVNARLIGELPHNASDIEILGEGCTPVIDQVAYDGMNRRQRMRTLSKRWCRISWNDQVGWVYGRYLRPM